MSAVATARTDLYAALLDVDVAGWRVHRTSPANIAAPCVYVDSPSISSAAGLVTVSFPVVAIVDGAQHRQLEQLDDLLVELWNAAGKVGIPTSSSPAALDVGGPSLRAQVITVEIVMAAVTFCSPTLTASARS